MAKKIFIGVGHGGAEIEAAIESKNDVNEEE